MSAGEEAAKYLHRLSQKNLPASEYSGAISALGELEYAPAVDTIVRYLRGKTRAAATVALMRISPERAKPALEEYVARNLNEGVAVAGIGLLDHYRKHGDDGLLERIRAVPKEILVQVPKRMKLPEDLAARLEEIIPDDTPQSLR